MKRDEYARWNNAKLTKTKMRLADWYNVCCYCCCYVNEKENGEKNKKNFSSRLHTENCQKSTQHITYTNFLIEWTTFKLLLVVPLPSTNG